MPIPTPSLFAGITINGLLFGQAAILSSYGIASVAGGGPEWVVTLTNPISDDELLLLSSQDNTPQVSVRRDGPAVFAILQGDPVIFTVVWHRIPPGADGIPIYVEP